jgi:hypothetical protein
VRLAASNYERIIMGPTCLSSCLGNPRPTQVGRSHKGPSHNCQSGNVGEWWKYVYVDKKHKSFYTS